MLSYAVFPRMTARRHVSYLALPSRAAHGAGSAFARLVECEGLLISIGAEKQAGFRPNDSGYTISNHAAVLAGAPWRRMKVFAGVYYSDFAEIRRYAAYK